MAEAEFVASKLWLHRCREQKELLTEHLFTIIQQNEVRKARKLAELMGHLEMDGIVSDADLPTLPTLPLLHNDVKAQRQGWQSPVNTPLQELGSSPEKESDPTPVAVGTGVVDTPETSASIGNDGEIARQTNSSEASGAAEEEADSRGSTASTDQGN